MHDRVFRVKLVLFFAGVLSCASGCGPEKTVYVDDYQELRPYVTSVLTATTPAPVSGPSEHAQTGDALRVEALSTGGS